MKYTNFRAFEKHLEGAAPNKHFADIYMIIAKESFDRKTALDRLTSLLLSTQKSPDLSLKAFDAEKIAIGDVMMELNAFSFFSEKRLVVIHNAEKLTKPSMAEFEAYFLKPNRNACLIITASAINHATNFYKKGEKAGIVLEVAEEKPWEKEKSLTEWINSTISAQGKSIAQQACQMLLKQTGTDQTLIHNELEKLLCFVGDRKEISFKDIGAVCSSVNIENAWQLGDAIFRSDANAALRIAKALLADGVAFLALLRQIRSQFQIKYQICSLIANAGTSADVAQQYPYMKGQILDRNIQMATSYGMPRFKKGMLKIDETEIQAKNSMTDENVLAELLIINLATQEKR